MATLADLRDADRRRRPDRRACSAKLDDYWQTFDPLFDWTPAEKILRSAAFLRREVVPRREAVLTIAQEIEELNNANVAGAASGSGAAPCRVPRATCSGCSGRPCCSASPCALIVVVRLRVLERRSEEAERQMRELSQQLVNTQEEERKNLSRELHDHVAQVLTGLRMELGRIERTQRRSARSPVVAECRKLVDDMFRTVRESRARPAPEHARRLRPAGRRSNGTCATSSSRYGVDVELKIEGDFDALPDKHRTCVYRVVQEAMTNCVRHAQATTILDRDRRADEGQLRVAVTDDGIGLDPDRRRRGLGLRGIDERVKELRGTMTIARRGGRQARRSSRAAAGARGDDGDVPLARAAG